MGLANADVLCGLELRDNLAHVVARRRTLRQVLVKAPGGFHLAAGASGLARMADLPANEHNRLLDELRALEAAADVILIDTGAGISPNVLTFAAAADRLLVVTTPEPTSITDAYATIKVAMRERTGGSCGESTGISLLVNQARSAAEARSVYERIAQATRQFLHAGLDNAGFLPIDAAVGKAVRGRVPFVVGQPKSPAAVAVTRLAARLEQGVAAGLPIGTPGAGTGRSFFGRLTRRS